MNRATFLLAALLIAAGMPANAEERILFKFDKPDDAKPWRTVNDGVMGGRSDGRFKINEDKNMQFFGSLSLENNGGFASVRARQGNLALESDDVIVARVRGDGREYTVNVYTQPNLGGYSYRQSFQTKKGEWIEVEFPENKFVATWRGRFFPNEKLDPSKVTGLGFLLGDKKSGPFKLEVEWIKVRNNLGEMFKALCEGTYKHHLQGVCTDEKSIFWSFTTTVVKTNMEGTLLKQVPVANHHGDLCFHEGKLYVAVNLGKFNDPQGNADSWVYVYDAETLTELARHETQEVFHGAGGIGIRDGHFFVVGGLPDEIEENYVYEYDRNFKFLTKHVIQSGHTHLGIQTATFAHDRWWLGCYGDPKLLLVTDTDFRIEGRYEIDCSFGIDGLSGGRILVGNGRCEKDKGCNGNVQTAFPDKNAGFTFQGGAVK
ncbi:Complex I intermediate-associated protein 30 (CIA30) [Planctomycetes bacterium CA13]|uniref:Complex I intermediate-associated protein 30 (CIA30) n=1 Tax=Novipirellula herctigrandis TaxID=2527986 RepID=A0A5C5ZCX8_9BACT|nr:Complex I intermediate-associated protein 30 (CIA30) [Planctomycetes bacterium CA13]